MDFLPARAGAGDFQCFRLLDRIGVQAAIVRPVQRGKPNMRVISSAAAVVVLAGLTTQASAQTPEQFYAGKNIDFVIGYPTGGANDVWARVIARHIGKHIPGKPNVIPKNQPGAGSFLAVNTVYSVSPKDGTVLA